MPTEIYLFWLIIVVALILLGLWGISKVQPQARRYGRASRGEQMETDLRLPYKRFKELYPESMITYQEYKQLQTQRAFRRALSSEKNKRMVR